MESQFPYFLLLALVFIFFIVVPSMRRSGKEKKFLKNLKKGDRVITKSGVHARINEFDEKNTTCVIDTMAGKLKIEKSAISLELSSNLNT
ncbi:MAG: preprotein translocase subunit YajC [Cryomorphaceae bacterium]|jgi:preprotein translocase subunit YajC|nr:preprotein translocase subunit YajC [Cryomorphaceae bacterium]MDG1889643.1 preprotein translocase subunit YajC [Flavobacteriaceae bacterium]MBT3503399.1 preprotein translocase subunit YajC [Cryomorphaceae bacterium]MBT3688637.1 preprotein translocase subunit YajC [Cryomorphaceae bacterium]MBT4222244.1 preprotein translocase subunit YajC [Cryomorphaceae bacterium]|tara:strand:- start:10 stop:279 length:270 start_codon:yes stop_codon:yes gene_type:complete